MAKIDIISGFLGAGKTTLIKKLLMDALRGQQVVLIENEFGEIGIDGGFLKDAGIEIKEMNSGCICCSLVGDFGTALKEVVETYHPDRIIIEPSGVGKLSDVIHAVERVQEEADLQLNCAATVVDVTKCKMYLKNFGEFFKNQVEAAGTVILSRTDLPKATDEKVEEALKLIRELTPDATAVTKPVEELGGKKVFYDQTLVRQEFENGKIVTITPDDVMQQLFLQMGDGEDAESKNPIHEYNPSLRIQENVDAVQNALNYLSFKCGLGTRHYQFSGSNVTTATQYSGDRQDMRQNVAKHAIYVEQALQQIVRAILWVGKTILGAPVDPDTEITVSFDDGYFTDNETTRALMAQDVRDGIIPKWKYAARWYDLDEDAAKELVAEAGGSDDAPALFGGDA